MLNDEKILKYIKRSLGWPFMHLEWTDTDILDHIRDISIRTYSYYIPDVKKLPVDTSIQTNKVPGVGNEFYLHEPEGREILSVVDIYFDQSDFYALGHPPMGAFSHFELREWALQTAMAMETKMFSSFDKTFEFRHPNVVRISPILPSQTKYITVEYERMQAEDFSEIPNDQHQYFLDLALADVMIAIGRIRKRYGGGTLRTPFGEIPLESDIYEEGKEKREKVIETLERLFIPNVRIDHG